MNKIEAGGFYYLKNCLVYVNRINGTMAFVTCADNPAWHKKVPVCKLKTREVS